MRKFWMVSFLTSILMAMALGVQAGPVGSAARGVKQRSFIGLEVYRQWNEQGESLFKAGTTHENKAAFTLDVKLTKYSNVFGKVGTDIDQRGYFTQAGIKLGLHF